MRMAFSVVEHVGTGSSPADARWVSTADGRSTPGPDEDRGETECGLVRDCELVRSHSQAAPLLEPVDASLDRVALLVRLRVEGQRPAARTASPQTVADLAGRLGDDSADTALAEVTTDPAGRVCAVREDGIKPCPGSSGSASRNTDGGHDGLEGRSVACLACGDAEGQGPCTAVAGEVDLCAQAATGASERVVVGFGRAWSPPVQGSGGMLVSPARGGIHRHSPADVVCPLSCCQHRAKDAFPGSVDGPPNQPFMGGLERAELVGQVPPCRLAREYAYSGLNRLLTCGVSALNVQ